MKTVLCDRCDQWAVRLSSTTPQGVQLWKCDHCGEIRAWCPKCDQGWVRHLIMKPDQTHLYSCDECDASWRNRDDVGINDGFGLWQIMDEKEQQGIAVEFEIVKDEN